MSVRDCDDAATTPAPGVLRRAARATKSAPASRAHLRRPASDCRAEVARLQVVADALPARRAAGRARRPR